MNREAILEIADLIERANPRNFHMGSWFGQLHKYEDLLDLDEYSYYEIEDYFSGDDEVNVGLSSYQFCDPRNILDPAFQDSLSCNTTACIAGWAVFNSYIKNKTDISSMIESQASELLDLKPREASRLFFCGNNTIWDEVADQYEFEYDREIPETWNFPPVMVASVLRRIANGDLCLDDESYNSII